MSKATLKDAIRITIGALLLTAGIAYAGTWTAPSQTFPNGNVDAPINVGSTMQTKTGGIWASAFATLGGGYFGGSVGIGTSTPLAKLHIGGTAGTDGIMFPDGTLQTTASGGLSGTRRELTSSIIKGLRDIVGSAIPYNATPLITQGIQLFSVSATASNAGSKISLRGSIQAYTGYSAEPPVYTIWKDSTLVATALGSVPIGGVQLIQPSSFEVEMANGDTSSHVYQVRIGTPNSRAIFLNNSPWSGSMGDTITSIFVVEEILP